MEKDNVHKQHYDIKVAIEQKLGIEVVEIKNLSGGISFETNLIRLKNNRLLVFRAGIDYTNSGHREIKIIDCFSREKFFYDTLANKMQIRFPNIILIDDSLKYYDKIFELYDFIEGIPLHMCLDEFDGLKQRQIYYEMGKIVAQINNTKLNKNHTYIQKRGAWNHFFSNRLEERLIPLIKNCLISKKEIEILVLKIKQQDYQERDLSFLHLDIRPNNFVWNSGISALLDAENSEWGDPYFELARIDVYKLLNEDFLMGYRQESDIKVIDFQSLVYKFYKLEGCAFLLNVFLNEICSDEEEIKSYLTQFLELKLELLSN